MADVYVQAVLIAVVVRAPDGLTQSVVGHDMPALIGQLLQNGPLGGRQRGSAIWAVNGGVLQIHRDTAQRYCAGAAQFGPVGALQNMLDAQEQFLHQKWFCQVVVRAEA